MSALHQVLDDFRRRQVMRFLKRTETRLAAADSSGLTAGRETACRIRNRADRVIAAADTLLAEQATQRIATPVPKRSDWVHRPALWTRPMTPFGHAAPVAGTDIGLGITLHHDCPINEISVRQKPNEAELDIPFGLSMDVLGFEGSYLSLAIPFPDEARSGLTKSMLFRLDINHREERRGGIYARLNLRHGPNTEQIVRELEPDARAIDFDMFYAELDASEVSGIWLDLILQMPAMNRLDLFDLVLSRRRRADV